MWVEANTLFIISRELLLVFLLLIPSFHHCFICRFGWLNAPFFACLHPTGRSFEDNKLWPLVAVADIVPVILAAHKSCEANEGISWKLYVISKERCPRVSKCQAVNNIDPFSSRMGEPKKSDTTLLGMLCGHIPKPGLLFFTVDIGSTKKIKTSQENHQKRIRRTNSWTHPLDLVRNARSWWRRACFPSASSAPTLCRHAGGGHGTAMDLHWSCHGFTQWPPKFFNGIMRKVWFYH